MPWGWQHERIPRGVQILNTGGGNIPWAWQHNMCPGGTTPCTAAEDTQMSNQ